METCPEHERMIDRLEGIERGVLDCKNDIHGLQQAVDKVSGSLLGTFNGGVGLVARLVAIETALNRHVDDRQWFRRALISALIGMVASVGLATFAAIK